MVSLLVLRCGTFVAMGKKVSVLIDVKLPGECAGECRNVQHPEELSMNYFYLAEESFS